MPPRKGEPFDAQAFLESAGLDKRVVRYARGGVIFSQGDACDSVMYLREGEIRLSVLSHTGKEAIVATLGAGGFLGEGALAGHPVRHGRCGRGDTPQRVLPPFFAGHDSLK